MAFKKINLIKKFAVKAFKIALANCLRFLQKTFAIYVN